MIRFCRHYYRDNPFELEKIDDFEQNYRLENILRWYTQECFVYKMINKALRSEDLEQLLRFSFLIAALSKRLADGQNNPRRKMPSTITVYRGVRLHRTEVDRLMKSVNLLICNQGFWSSSLRRGRALAFAKSYAATDEICPVLFEISCDTREDRTRAVFVDISEESSHPLEEEILFDLGTPFKITAVIRDDEKYVIQLELAGDSLSITDSYFLQKRHALENKRTDLSLVMLLCELGRYRKAQQYLEQLLHNANDEDRIWIELNLGRTKFYQNQLDQAKTHYDQVYKTLITVNPPRILDATIALENIALALKEQGRLEEALKKHQDVLNMREKQLRPNDINIQRSLINIGNVYHALNNYDTALQHYRKALQLHNDYPSENLREKAICLNHIGSTEIEQGNYSAARDAFQQAFQIRQQILPPDHPHIAESLYNIGIVQRQQGDYHDALDSCRRALAIRQKLFSDDHPLVADTFELKAKIYHSQNRFQDALEIHRKVLHIREKSSPNTHADIAQSLNNIGINLKKTNQLDQALKHSLEALKIHSRNIASKHFDRFACLNNIGDIYRKQKNYTEAMEYHQKALKLAQQYFSANHPYTADSLHNIGIVFQAQNKYDNALKFYSQSLAIREKTLSPNHANIAASYKSIAHLYWNSNHFDQALEFYQRCLAIRREQNRRNSCDIGDDLYYVALTYEKLNQINEALKHLKEARSFYQMTKSENHSTLMDTENAIRRLSISTVSCQELE
ncbi:unnamed protein product [Rotaria sp. Silwood1]|nr:unnamed protein product [Rotaria sp. Silwood1]